MNTQCQPCKAVLAVPNEYKGKAVSCTTCGQSFNAVKFKKPPIIVPSDIPRSGHNFFGKIWTKSPLAFRTAFLATLGVISALWFAWYVAGLGHSLKPSFTKHPAYEPKTYDNASTAILTGYDFEQRLEIKPGETEPRWAFLWRAWVYNPSPHWVKGQYFIELRNSNGLLLDACGPIAATFPNATEPREANGLYWPSNETFIHTDLTKSKIRIRIK